MIMRLGHSHMCGKSKIFYPHIYFAGILPFTWKRHRHMPVCIRREVCFRPRGKSQSADRKANNVQGYSHSRGKRFTIYWDIEHDWVYSHSRGKKYKCLAALYVIVGILPLAWEKASRAILLLHFFGYTPTCVGKVNSFILHIYFAGVLPLAWEKGNEIAG